MLVCGVDVGNSTTEVAFAQVEAGREPDFLLVLRRATTGSKGSRANAEGVLDLVRRGARRVGAEPRRLLIAQLQPAEATLHDAARDEDIDLGRVAVARPASATPSAAGVGVGRLCRLSTLAGAPPPQSVIPIINETGYEQAAAALGDARSRGWRISAVIVRADEAVLIGNRFDPALPIVDEVTDAADLPDGALAVVEVAAPGATVVDTADPLRLAVLLGLSPAEARGARNAARVVTGQRAAIAIAQPAAPSVTVPESEPEPVGDVTDRFVIDLPRPRDDAALTLRLRRCHVQGVATLRQAHDDGLVEALDAYWPTRVVCSEPDAAVSGASTTPGAGATPLVIDIGGGTIDVHRPGAVAVKAGAGELVTMICAALLGASPSLAERAKRGRSVRVETPFVLHHEDSSREFLRSPAPPATLARLCLVGDRQLEALPALMAPEVWQGLRRAAKRDVLVTNVRRGLDASGGVPRGELVTLVGGCAADTEVVQEVQASLVDLDVAVARADVLGRYGPRAAVAVGLVRVFAQRPG